MKIISLYSFLLFICLTIPLCDTIRCNRHDAIVDYICLINCSRNQIGSKNCNLIIAFSCNFIKMNKCFFNTRAFCIIYVHPRDWKCFGIVLWFCGCFFCCIFYLFINASENDFWRNSIWVLWELFFKEFPLSRFYWWLINGRRGGEV